MRCRHGRFPLAGRALGLVGLASLTVGLILLPAASRSVASVAGGTAGPASRSAVTVAGPHLYDPATGKQFPYPSKVTVSQTTGLVNQLIHVSWAGFTPSVVDPSEPWYTFNGGSATDYPVMVAECHGTHPTKWNQCSGAADSGVPIPKNSNGILNTAYAITTGKGTGEVPFDVQTAAQNKPLGCDQHHPCSLVIVPGQGGTPKNCNDHSQDVNTLGTGNAAPINTFKPSTGGCSWKDRIVVPLRFAPVPTGCPPRNVVFSSAGSPMLANAMQQWLTGLCAGKNGMSISYISALGEQTAVGDEISRANDVAFTTRPASAQGAATSGKRFFYAPVAVSAVAIAYWIDDNYDGQPLSGLKLNQRLLAKLLTTSYDPALTDDKGVQGNPFNIFADPEFAALDKSMDTRVNPLNDQNFTIPTVMQGGSDMTWTVTSWIHANPTARSFLKGKPAPGGTHVNTYYKNVKYPTDQFIAQDPSTEYSKLYNPVLGLNNVVNYQAINAYPGDYWVRNPITGNFDAIPPEPVGDRALIAIMDNGDAALDQFPVAAIPNAAGKYVLPSNAGMAAALSHMISGGNGTLQVNLANTDPKAYPLTMVIYAMVPASGLTHTKAAAIARFLDYAAGPGQVPGLRPGELPPGYLPLTSALRSQTKSIAAKVAKEKPRSSGGGGGGSSSPSPTPSPGGSVPATPSPSASVSLPSPSPAATGEPVTLLAAHSRPAAVSRFVLPALLILAGAAALSGSFVLAESVDGGIAASLRRLRRLGRGAATRGRPSWRTVTRAAPPPTGRGGTRGRSPWRRKP